MNTAWIHTICAEHNETAIVGPATPLEELECGTCTAIQDGLIAGTAPTDPEALFVSRITSHYGGNCCCESCDPSYCFGCDHYYGFCTCTPPVSLYKTLAQRRRQLDAEVPF